MKKLNRRELQLIADATLKKTAKIGLLHAKENVAYIRKTIMDLKTEDSLPTVVISAGSSLHRNKSLLKLKEENLKGYIVAVDGTLGQCLRNNIVPDYVLTVDPHPHRIIRWFGDTKFTERPTDDYFRRQDLDPSLNCNESIRNKELIELVNRYGPKIKVIISTSVSPEITRRCIEAGMELYWWNPLYDDYDNSKSYSRQIYQITKVPCMVTGGNCGTSALVFSHTVLKSKFILMVGMDFSYPPETSVINTQYYDILKELYPEDPEEGLIKVYNPYLKQTWLTDPAYYWYNQIFLDMAKIASYVTYNCTEGGILFGKNIEFIPLKEGLQKLKEYYNDKRKN